MKIVGEALLLEADQRDSLDEKDLFIRSAINRLYYASYWCARSFVADFWKGKEKDLKHANLPTWIGDHSPKLIKPMNPVSDDIKIVTRESKNIEMLLGNAYKVRCTADYNPELKVVFRDNDFHLSFTSTASARSWESQISDSVRQIRRVYKKYGLG